MQISAALAVNLDLFVIITNKNAFYSTPLGSTCAFVRPRLTYITYIIPLMAVAGMRGSAGGCQPTKQP